MKYGFKLKLLESYIWKLDGECKNLQFMNQKRTVYHRNIWRSLLEELKEFKVLTTGIDWELFCCCYNLKSLFYITMFKNMVYIAKRGVY